MKLSLCIFILVLFASHHHVYAQHIARPQTKSHSHPRVIDSLPPPNEIAIRKIRTADEWNNPYVVVYADGYELLRHDDNREDAHLSLEELKTVVLDLPAQQWPLGKVIAAQEIGPRSPGDEAKIASKLRSLKLMLESYKLRVALWPSS